MPLGGSNLFFDQIEIIEQPFRARRNPAVGRDCGGERITDCDQHLFIRGQPRQQLIRRARGRELVRTRQGLAVPLQLVGTQEFRSQWLLVDVILWRYPAAEKRPPMEQFAENVLSARLQF